MVFLCCVRYGFYTSGISEVFAAYLEVYGAYLEVCWAYLRKHGKIIPQKVGKKPIPQEA